MRFPPIADIHLLTVARVHSRHCGLLSVDHPPVAPWRMDDARERLEYIGSMAREMAQLARELDRAQLSQLLQAAAAVAEMDLAAKLSNAGAHDTAH